MGIIFWDGGSKSYALQVREERGTLKNINPIISSTNNKKTNSPSFSIIPSINKHVYNISNFNLSYVDPVHIKYSVDQA